MCIYIYIHIYKQCVYIYIYRDTYIERERERVAPPPGPPGGVARPPHPSGARLEVHRPGRRRRSAGRRGWNVSYTHSYILAVGALMVKRETLTFPRMQENARRVWSGREEAASFGLVFGPFGEATLPLRGQNAQAPAFRAAPIESGDVQRPLPAVTPQCRLYRGHTARSHPSNYI